MAAREPELLRPNSILYLGQPERQKTDANAAGNFPPPYAEARVPRVQRVEYSLTGDIGKHILLQIYKKMYQNVLMHASAPLSDTDIRYLLIQKFRFYNGLLNICLATVMGISDYSTLDTAQFLAYEFAGYSYANLYEYFVSSYFDTDEMNRFIANLHQKMSEYTAKTRSTILALGFYNPDLYNEHMGKELTNEQKEKQLSTSSGFEWLAILDRDIDSHEKLKDISEDNIGIHITLAAAPFARTLEKDGISMTFSDLMHISDQGYTTSERTWYTIQGMPIINYFLQYVAQQQEQQRKNAESVAALAAATASAQTNTGKKFVALLATKAKAKTNTNKDKTKQGGFRKSRKLNKRKLCTRKHRSMK